MPWIEGEPAQSPTLAPSTAQRGQDSLSPLYQGQGRKAVSTKDCLGPNQTQVLFLQDSNYPASNLASTLPAKQWGGWGGPVLERTKVCTAATHAASRQRTLQSTESKQCGFTPHREALPQQQVFPSEFQPEHSCCFLLNRSRNAGVRITERLQRQESHSEVGHSQPCPVTPHL